MRQGTTEYIEALESLQWLQRSDCRFLYNITTKIFTAVTKGNIEVLWEKTTAVTKGNIEVLREKIQY